MSELWEEVKSGPAVIGWLWEKTPGGETEAKHADGTDLGAFSSKEEAEKAVRRYQFRRRFPQKYWEKKNNEKI